MSFLWTLLHAVFTEPQLFHQTSNIILDIFIFSIQVFYAQIENANKKYTDKNAFTATT